MKTGNGAQSYLKAGYKPTTRNSLDASASQLLRVPKVHRRIMELRKQMATRERITVGSLVDELDEARALAVRLEQPASAIQASMSKAKLVGLLVDRKETGQPGDFAAQTPEAVLDLVRAELGDATADALLAALAQRSTAPAAPEPVVERGDDTLQ